MAEKDRYRTKQFLIRLFPEEMEILEAKAKEFGISKSDYIRDMILYGEVKKGQTVYESENFQQLLSEISRISSNVKRITYNLDFKKSAGTEDVNALKKQYDDLLAFVEETVICMEKKGKRGD